MSSEKINTSGNQTTGENDIAGVAGNVGGEGRYFVVRPAQHITASGSVASHACDDDQRVLMEARLMEIITSICQLIISNERLENALKDCHDNEFVEALRENDSLIKRKQEEARVLAGKLRRVGIDVRLDDKIPLYSGSSLLQTIDRYDDTESKERDSRDGGVYL